MDKLIKALTGQYMLWLILAIPGIGLCSKFLQGDSKYGMLLHVSGETAVRLLVISLIASPIALLFPKTKVARWFLRNRRFFGVATFAYSLLHTIFYVLKEPFSKMVDEFFNVGIFTGWIAFFIFIPLAITSTNYAVKRMGKNWKKLQRWVYLATVLTIVHWALINTKHNHWVPALMQFSPVILLSIYLIWHLFFRKKVEKNLV
jgi:methionine sulfoxide reductase heme-binding subunit